MTHLLRVTAPHFTAGLVIEHGKVIEAAPILSWALGKEEYYCNRYFKSKKWEVNHIPLEKAE